MNCAKCGIENVKDSKFCSKCGASLTGEKEKNELVEKVKVGAVKTKNVCLENLKLIMNFILKPATSLKDEITKLDDIKNSGILVIVIAVISTLISLFTTMINAVIVEEYYMFGEYSTVWRWENLKNINYISSIFQSLISVLLVIAVIAGIYYIASLIIKKEVKFSRLVGLTSLSITPLLLTSLVISPILSLISSEISALATIVASIYTMLMIHETINNEFKLKGNAKYYFNLVCYLIFIVIGYIAVSVVVSTVINTSANSLFGMIK